MTILLIAWKSMWQVNFYNFGDNISAFWNHLWELLSPGCEQYPRSTSERTTSKNGTEGLHRSWLYLSLIKRQSTLIQYRKQPRGDEPSSLLTRSFARSRFSWCLFSPWPWSSRLDSSARIRLSSHNPVNRCLEQVPLGWRQFNRVVHQIRLRRTSRLVPANDKERMWIHRPAPLSV